MNKNPTNALAAIANPIKNIKNNEKLTSLFHKNQKQAMKCKIFPKRATFLLPIVSLSLGSIKDPTRTPVKNSDPNRPKSAFFEH